MIFNYTDYYTVQLIMLNISSMLYDTYALIVHLMK